MGVVASGAVRRWASITVVGVIAAAAVVGTASAADVTVEARDDVFVPRTVTVDVGDTITWRNTGMAPHTVTSSADDGASFDATIDSGETFALTVDTAGTVDYFCRFHGSAAGNGMAGTVEVQGTQPSTRTTDRLSGAGRIQTAIAISQEAFPNGASTVYLSSQDVNPDALVGGALTAGPVLLVPSCGTLPSEVAAEIRRLGADRVVALGGARTVCDDILRQAGNA